MAERELVIRPRRVLRALVAATVILIVMSAVAQSLILFLPDFPFRDGIYRFFSADSEPSLPTLYSTVLFLVSALLAGVIARARTGADQPSSRQWAAVSLLLLILALDEFASFHEGSVIIIRKLLGIPGGGWLATSWVLLGAVVAVLLLVVSLPFLRGLPPATRRRFLWAGLLFVTGAMGMEVLGGLVAEISFSNVPVVAISTLEELLEMLGLAVLVYALLAYMPIGLSEPAWRTRIAPD